MTAGVRYVEVVYCDDIREEVGNKISHMGIYLQDLYVPACPIVLPKLCIAVSVVTDHGDPFESLEVRVLKGDEGSELVTTGTIALSPTPVSTEDGSNGSVLMMHMNFMLSPFQIDGETTLRIRVRTEREELKGRALRIRVAQTPETQP